MSTHLRLDDSLRDLAVLYALQGPPESGVGDYAAHLAGCAVCRDEVAALTRTLGSLAELAPRVEPPPELRARLLERTAHEASAGRRTATAPAIQTWKQWAGNAPAGGLPYVPASLGAWEPTAIAGIAVRKLHVDREHDRATMLIRMDAGTSYPGHRHGGVEECYVLEGDLRVGEILMRAGDYQRVETGSEHPVQATESGCLLFIVSSLRDELLESGAV